MLTDYQIVNGCQTSHVLYENRKQSLFLVLTPTYTDQFFFHNTIFHFHRKYYNMSLSSFENLIKIYSKIVDFIVKQDTIDFDDRKTFERKETTEELLSKVNEMKRFINQ